MFVPSSGGRVALWATRGALRRTGWKLREANRRDSPLVGRFASEAPAAATPMCTAGRTSRRPTRLRRRLGGAVVSGFVDTVAILDAAVDLGIDRTGVCTVEPFEETRLALEHRKAAAVEEVS